MNKNKQCTMSMRKMERAFNWLLQKNCRLRIT